MSEPIAGLSVAAAAGLDRALAALDRARQQPYYDPDADAAAAAGYYRDTPPDRLGLLVTVTHERRPRYNPSQELYPWVDLQPDRMLHSLYTGEVFEPAELIRADFAIQARRMMRAQSLALTAEPDAAVIAAQLDEMLPFNCEHVVPQSWFGKAEPMRGDLHHLFACESRCNSFRGNTAYAEFADWPPPAPDLPEGALAAVVRDACGKRDTAAFEPAHGKGPAARATFYVALRYPAVIDPDELDPERFGDLLLWHQSDPVTDWERHRNAAIFDRQGNRNPFIDRPELAHDLLPTLTSPPADDD